MDKRAARAKALELMDCQPFVVVSSLGEAGYPESRAVFNLRAMARTDGSEPSAAACPWPSPLKPPFAGLADGFSTYLGTNASSRKSRQLLSDGRACLYFHSAAGSLHGLEVLGRFSESSDRTVRQGLWRDGWERYYPRGPEDPDFAVFLFTPEVARYYEGLGVFEFREGEVLHA